MHLFQHLKVVDRLDNQASQVRTHLQLVNNHRKVDKPWTAQARRKASPKTHLQVQVDLLQEWIHRKVEHQAKIHLKVECLGRILTKHLLAAT